MKTELIKWEIKKLWMLPMMPVFLTLCVIFNFLIIAESRYGHSGAPYVDYVRRVSDQTGSQMGSAFDVRAALLPEEEYKQVLLTETVGAEDIFETYDVSQLYEAYTAKFNMQGYVAEALEKKYSKLENRVTELAERDASMDLAAAGMTKYLMDALFERLCKAVITEGMILAVMIALYICGREQTERTQLIVYATRRGRLIQREKAAAGLIMTAVEYAILQGISIALFAAVWRLGPIWNADMSSQFYYVSDLGIKLPFVSWADFSVAGYLAAVTGLGFAVAVIFYALAYSAGLACSGAGAAGNAYKGFLAVLVFVALNFAVIIAAGNSGWWLMYEGLLWTPVGFWWTQPVWFSELGASTLVSWQECRAAAVCMTVCALLLFGLFRRFYKKEI